MFCLDFSANSKKAFDTGVKLVNPTADEVILVSVCETYRNDLFNTIRVGCDFQLLEEANESLVNDTEMLLLDYSEKLNLMKITHSKIVKVGNPKEIICQLVATHEIDFLILGSRGLTTVKNWFLEVFQTIVLIMLTPNKF